MKSEVGVKRKSKKKKKAEEFRLARGRILK